MPTPPDKTSPATAEDVRAALGEVDAEVADEILALKPTIGDLEEAAAAMDAEGETSALTKVAAGIAEIMIAEEEEEDDEEPEADEKEPDDKKEEDEKEDDEKEEDDEEKDEDDEAEEKKKKEEKRRH
jgi:hypothetical protein